MHGEGLAKADNQHGRVLLVDRGVVKVDVVHQLDRLGVVHGRPVHGGDDNEDDDDDDTESENENENEDDNETTQRESENNEDEEVILAKPPAAKKARQETAEVNDQQFEDFKKALFFAFEDSHQQQLPMEEVKKVVFDQTSLTEAQLETCIEKMTEMNKVMKASDILYLI